MCGRASAVWSCYPCADADLIDGTNSSGRSVTYVADLDGYAPMCWTHANAHDRSRAALRRLTGSLALSPLPPRRNVLSAVRMSDATVPQPEALFDLDDWTMGGGQ